MEKDPELDTTFDSAVSTYGKELARLNKRLPLIVALGESDQNLQRRLVREWKRDIIYVTAYLTNPATREEKVGDFTYRTVAMAMPDVNQCGAKCRKTLNREEKHRNSEEEREEELDELPDEKEIDDSLRSTLGKGAYQVIFGRKSRRNLVALASHLAETPISLEAKKDSRAVYIGLKPGQRRKRVNAFNRKKLKALKTSTFVMHHHGDIRDVRGVYDSLVNGAIPVLTSEPRWRFPSEIFGWDYQKFTVTADLQNFQHGGLVDHLAKIPKTSVRQIQHAGFMLKKQLSWRPWMNAKEYRSDGVRDGFDLMMLELFYRFILTDKSHELRVSGIKSCDQMKAFTFPPGGFSAIADVRDLLKPEISKFLSLCANITVSPRDFFEGSYQKLFKSEL